MLGPGSNIPSQCIGRDTAPIWDTEPIWKGASIIPCTQSQLMAEKICIRCIKTQDNSFLAKQGWPGSKKTSLQAGRGCLQFLLWQVVQSERISRKAMGTHTSVLWEAASHCLALWGPGTLAGGSAAPCSPHPLSH